MTSEAGASIELLLDDFEEAVKEAAYSDCSPMGDPGNYHKHMERDEARKALLAKLEAADRLVEACERLWALCVDEGFPWSEGSVQDELTELGFLVATDMTGEDEAELCKNCEGECRTCYRSIKSLAALPKEPT